ncbi:hypothetical protein LTR85_011177 [Meristemomyces frigidus]|nr:hypothetical protein LTR85_011177 [Meristemomyces frigidus]
MDDLPRDSLSASDVFFGRNTGPPGSRNIRAGLPLLYPYGGGPTLGGRRPPPPDEIFDRPLRPREMEDAYGRPDRYIGSGGGGHFDDGFHDTHRRFPGISDDRPRGPPGPLARMFHDQEHDDVFASLRGADSMDQRDSHWRPPPVREDPFAGHHYGRDLYEPDPYDAPMEHYGTRWGPPSVREDNFGGDSYGRDRYGPDSYDGPPMPPIQRPMYPPYTRRRDRLPGLIPRMEDDRYRMEDLGGRAFPPQSPPQQRDAFDERFNPRDGGGGMPAGARGIHDRRQGGGDDGDDVFRDFFGQ